MFITPPLDDFYARPVGRASAPARSEDLVAEKWEQKANKGSKKPRASTSSIPASTKRKAGSPPPSSSREAKKRPEAQVGHRSLTCSGDAAPF